MASTITLIPQDDRAERILDAFEQRTGLTAEHDEDGRVYALEGDDHRVAVVQTLDEIDPEWTGHVGLGAPA